MSDARPGVPSMRRVRRSMYDVVREAFISGLAVVVPLVITVAVFLFLFNAVYGYLKLFSEVIVALPIVSLIPEVLNVSSQTVIEAASPVIVLVAVLGLGRDDDAVSGVFPTSRALPEVELDAEVLGTRADRPLDVVLVAREDVVEHLHDGHVGAQFREHRRQFHPDVARADDDESVRQRVHIEEVLGGQHGVVGEVEAGDLDRSRPRRDDRVLELDGLHPLSLAAVGDSRGVLVLERRGPLQERDAVRLTELLDAARQLIDDAGLPLLHPAHIHCRIGVYADVFGGRRVVCDVRAVDERLRGDTAPVQTGSAEGVLLDQGRVETLLCTANRCHVSAGSRPDHEEVRRRGDVAHYHTDSHSLPVQKVIRPTAEPNPSRPRCDRFPRSTIGIDAEDYSSSSREGSTSSSFTRFENCAASAPSTRR